MQEVDKSILVWSSPLILYIFLEKIPQTNPTPHKIKIKPNSCFFLWKTISFVSFLTAQEVVLSNFIAIALITINKTIVTETLLPFTLSLWPKILHAQLGKTKMASFTQHTDIVFHFLL